MPDVLYPLRGEVVRQKDNSLVVVKKGVMSTNELNQYVSDLVEFLDFVAEPNRKMRYKIGVGVLIFIAILIIILRKLQLLYIKKTKR